MSAEAIPQEHERRDWRLMIFIIPLGILLMCIVGQIAIRLIPRWSVPADMTSNLDPNTASERPFSLLQPLIPQILTPMGWAGIYLTPGADISFPPFFVFEPGASLTPTPAQPTPTSLYTATFGPSPTATFGSVFTPTKTPPGGNPPTLPATATPKPGTEVPPPNKTFTPSPTFTPTTPPPTEEPTATHTEEPTATHTEEPTATHTEEPPAGFPSTPPPGYNPIPPPIGVVVGPPNGTVGSFGPNQYIVIDLGATPIIVDGNNDPDMVYYENAVGGTVFVDNVIVGISANASGSPFYIVFNWGDISGVTTNDTNTNLAGIIEIENAPVSVNDLYNPPSTGIAINVDGAASQPPPGSYQYVVILAQIDTTNDGDWLELDSILILP